MGPAIKKARAAQLAAMMVRVFMGLLLLISWSSFFIFRPAVLRAGDYRQEHQKGRPPGLVVEHRAPATAGATPLATAAAVSEPVTKSVCDQGHSRERRELGVHYPLQVEAATGAGLDQSRRARS